MAEKPVEIDPDEQVYADRMETDEYDETPQEMLADDEISGREEGFMRGYREEREAHFASEEVGVELPSDEENRT